MAKKKKFFSAPQPKSEQNQGQQYFEDGAPQGADSLNTMEPLDLFADEDAAANGFAALMQDENAPADGQQSGDFFGAAGQAFVPLIKQSALDQVMVKHAEQSETGEDYPEENPEELPFKGGREPSGGQPTRRRRSSLESLLSVCHSIETVPP